jgi:peptidoglycan hydrolase-like protein with peptidoglycan-binding domain
MSKLFLISEEEKNRILNLHEYAIKKEMASQKKSVKTMNEDMEALPEYEGVSLGKVEAVQQALVNLGYNIGNTGPNGDGVDGKFGEKTKASVKKFQTSKGLYSDGIVGEKTAGALGVQPLYVKTAGKSSSSSSGSKDSSGSATDSPFKNREEGNAFRKWMHKNFPNDAKNFDLNIEGDHANKTIKLVYNSKPKGYTTTTYGMYYERTKGQTQPDKAQQTKTDSATTKKPEISTDPKNRCIAISKEECDKISSTKETRIGSGSETRCSAYMVKCLSQYDSDLFGGNAWDAFNNVKGGGTVRYNLFTSGEVNWTKIWSDLAKNKVSKATCEKHAKTDDADRIVNSIVPSIVTNNIPSSPKFSINSLKLGDIVGLYHKNSSNKGMAFCQRALKRGLDNNGNVSDKDPFTFNSHVGFVGAIKNGVPIVIHNVSGNHMATPATQMLSKTSNDMITWVVSDSSIASAIESGDKASPEKKGYEFSLPKFNFGL